MTPEGREVIQPLCPRRTRKQLRWYLSHCVPGREQQIKNYWPVNKEVLGKSLLDCNFFPKPLTYPFLLLMAWDEMLRFFFLGYIPTVFLDHWHLNKPSIKIQSLSLLIGSSSDRQHKHRLSRFQVLDFVQERFHTMSPVILTVCLFRLGTVKQGRV